MASEEAINEEIIRKIKQSYNWSELEHAYGEATETPSDIIDLISDSETKRQNAFEHIYYSVLHQGTTYTSTAPVCQCLLWLLKEDVVHTNHKIAKRMLQFLYECGNTYLGDEIGSEIIRILVDGMKTFVDLLIKPNLEIETRMGIYQLIRTSITIANCEIKEKEFIVKKLSSFVDIETEWKTLGSLLLALGNIVECPLFKDSFFDSMKKKLFIHCQNKTFCDIVFSNQSIEFKFEKPIMEQIIDKFSKIAFDEKNLIFIRMCAAIGLLKFAHFNKTTISEKLLDLIEKGITIYGTNIEKCYEALPWQFGSIISDISCVLLKFGDSFVDIILKGIPNINSRYGLSIVIRSLLEMCFGPPKPVYFDDTNTSEYRDLEEINELQRKVLVAIANNENIWRLPNMSLTMHEYLINVEDMYDLREELGLPNTEESEDEE